MLNQIVVVGRLVKDPIVNETQDGKKLANITLAVQRSFRNLEGNYEVDFIDCVLWKGIAESTAAYCTKGSMIGIKGRLMTSLYKNEEGNTRKNVEVVAEKVSFLGYPSRNNLDDNNNINND
ncbi:MAG: single-stranded DNA-binding protein [Bacilli bacterium]|jgi:single-strand DNA-binding protein|nr:single-stranded DNA-binding protein [Bacilli bacterium]